MSEFSKLPERLSLSHATPEWVRYDSRYFITICCEKRHTDAIANAHTWATILKTSDIYRENRRWWPVVILAMPDHLHAVVSIPDGGSLQRSVRDFKHVVARFTGTVWQRDFFDHRIRNAESNAEKIAYVLNNPVRGGLTAKPEDWPYRYINPNR